MSNTKVLRPVKVHQRVLTMHGRTFPPEGLRVTMCGYYRRLIAQGALVEADAGDAKPPKADAGDDKGKPASSKPSKKAPKPPKADAGDDKGKE
ncbi:MAG: hypothetical protein KC543_10105 [Myxococcales bacterium]|nr:hypothetical protein [Myxococcales bacterium]